VERLYGRSDVLPRVRRGIERAASGQGQLLLFTGEPGIGKSRLAEQAAADAADRGATVAWGRCWEAGGAPAYWPWIQVFRSLDLGTDPFAPAARELSASAEEVRFAVFDRAVSDLKVAAARRPLTLLLDDLHAADAPSLLLLLLLARELPRLPLLVVGAYRDAEIRLKPEIAPLLARIAREAEVVPLPRLAAADVAAWVDEASVRPDAGCAAELYRITEGHPLFLVEALRLGRETGSQAAWSAGLAGVLDERLGALSAGTRALLEVGAVLGREFSTADLGATAGALPDRVHEAVREAQAASILAPAGDGGRVRFSHVLLRDRLYAELLPSARAALHVRAGDAVLAGAGDPQTAAHHFFEGQSAARPERIAQAALAAARDALSRLAFEDAARVARRALALAAGDGLPPPLAAGLQLAAAEALIRLGEARAARELCLAAAELAERAGADDLLAQAALVYGTELASGSVDPSMIALLRKALARLPEGDSALRARVMVRLSAALTPPVDEAHLPEIVQLTRGAIAMARRLSEPYTLLYVLQFAATVGLLVPDDERFGIMHETVALARALDQPLALLLALPGYITALLARAERGRADAAMPEYHALVARFPQPIHEIRRGLLDALFSALGGDFETSDRLSTAAHDLAVRARSEPGMTLWLTHRLSVAQLCGRPDVLSVDGPALLARFEWMPSAVPYITWLLAALGRHEEARARLASLDMISLSPMALFELMGAAEACVLLGRADLGHTIYPRLLLAADRSTWNLAPATLLGPIARVLGDLALLIGRQPEALRHYDEAIAFAEKLGAPPLTDLCRRRKEEARAAGAAPAALEAAPAAAGASVTTAGPELPQGTLELQREGELCAIRSPFGPPIHLRHSKGVQYLQYLVEQPGRQVHVLELVGLEQQASDAGPLLDARAKAEYRRRLDDLREELSEAERFADHARQRRIEQEIDALAEQLAGAVGLGGRDRRAASNVERTRINVQRRLKDVVDRVTAANPTLGRYLAAAVKTGTYCAYEPL
jgi:tetratricopeptide (TPR) repeat protein